MNYWFILMPLISAFLGWAGSWVAAKILFRRILPSRQGDLARVIGKQISNSFSLTSLQEKINDPQNVKKIMPLVEVHIDDFLRHKLKNKMPVVGMFIGDKTINSLKEVFLLEIEELFPAVLKQFAGNLQNELDIEALVINKINATSPVEIEQALFPALRYFNLAAAITGFIIGLVNACIFYFLNM